MMNRMEEQQTMQMIVIYIFSKYFTFSMQVEEKK